MPTSCSLNRIGGDANVAVSAIFKADGRGQTRSQLAMDLTFSCACANCAPRNQIANVLRRNDIKKLTASGQTQAVDFNQQLARNTQAFVNAKGFIKVGVVDQALPANSRARFFKVNPHHNFQCASVLFALLDQAACVFKCCSRIMNRTRTNHHQQAII